MSEYNIGDVLEKNHELYKIEHIHEYRSGFGCLYFLKGRDGAKMVWDASIGDYHPTDQAFDKVDGKVPGGESYHDAKYHVGDKFTKNDNLPEVVFIIKQVLTTPCGDIKYMVNNSYVNFLATEQELDDNYTQLKPCSNDVIKVNNHEPDYIYIPCISYVNIDEWLGVDNNPVNIFSGIDYGYHDTDIVGQAQVAKYKVGDKVYYTDDFSNVGNVYTIERVIVTDKNVYCKLRGNDACVPECDLERVTKD